MKKIIYAFCVALVLTSCYADKGNYDYTFDSLNAISAIKFTPEPVVTGIDDDLTYEFELPKPTGTNIVTKKIEVTLEQTLPTNEENLEYSWIRNYVKDAKSVTDTVYTHGYVEVALFGGQDTEYNIILSIYDKSTTLAAYYKVKVKTRLAYQNSLFVLHGNEIGKRKLGNVEKIGSTVDIVPDAYAEIYGATEENPFIRATHLGFFSSPIFTSLWAAGSPGGNNLYNPYGLNLQYDSNIVNPPNELPIQLSYVNLSAGEGSNGRTSVITSDGRLMVTLINGAVPLFFYPGAHSTAVDHIQPTNYQFSMVTRNDQKFVAWDKKNSRFLCTNAYESFPGIIGGADPIEARAKIKSTNPIVDPLIDYSPLTGDLALAGKEGLYMYEGGTETGTSLALALFQDPLTSSVYRYVLTPKDGKGDKGKSGKGDDKPTAEALYTITGAKLTNMTGVTASTPIVYWPMISDEMIYYAVGNKLYRYETFANKRVEIYSAPAGYTITVLRFKSIDRVAANRQWLDLIYYLCIGMNNGDHGAVAEIKLTNGGDKDVPYGEFLYEGFERIIDLQFAHIYLYKK